MWLARGDEVGTWGRGSGFYMRKLGLFSSISMAERGREIPNVQTQIQDILGVASDLLFDLQ